MQINPRYRAYARAHGKTPVSMLAHDRKAWPGGVMCGFIVWMSERKHEFYRLRPSAFFDRDRVLDQTAWTLYLLRFARSVKRTT